MQISYPVVKQILCDLFTFCLRSSKNSPFHSKANAVPLSQTVAFSLSCEELHSKQKSACKNSPVYFTKGKHMQRVYSYIPNIVFPAQPKLQVSVMQEEIALPRQIN